MRLKIKIIFFLFTIFILIIPLKVYSLDLKEVECNNDGSFYFTIIGTHEDESYTKDMIVEIDGKIVYGSWDRENIKDSYSVNQRYATFSMPENTLTENRIYKISLYYKEDDQSKIKEFDAECPGLIFTCNLLHVDIDKCYTTNGRFTAEITAKGLKQSKLPNGFNIGPEKALDFTMSTNKPYKAKTNIIYKRGSLPSEFTITEISPDNYQLNFDLEPGNYVKELSVAFSEDRSFPLYMLDKCSSDKYNLKLADHEVCSFNVENKPIIVTQNEPIVNNKEEIKSSEDIKNPITGQVIKNSYNTGNVLIFVIVIIIILLTVILILYSKVKNNKRKF